ncbi:MAG: glycosyltransferase family 39 protein [Chloroflexi bacterium]|nr:glycosyltransferase family 39 protein [Chloroflexota bacterium]
MSQVSKVSTFARSRARPDPRQAAERHRSSGAGLALPGAILALAAALRLVSVNWDAGQHLHPDERFLTMVATAIALPSSVAEYFDTATSPLNPYNRGHNSFVYGTLPLFIVRFLAEPLRLAGYDQVNLLGRVVSALFDVGTVLLTFSIATRLYGRRIGLLAALLLATTALHIQQSHFFTVDTFVTFFITAALYFTLRALERDALSNYLLAGGAVGLAMASKLNAALFVVVLALAVGLRLLPKRRSAAQRLPDQASDRTAPFGPLWGGATALVAAFALFRIAQPYAFTGPTILDIVPSDRYLQDMAGVQRLVSGEVDYPPSHQWTNTTPYVFPWQHMVAWGMAPALGLTAWAGVVLAAWQVARNWRGRHAQILLLAWVAINFAYWGGNMAKTMRYFLPIYPALVILGAALLGQSLDAAWRLAREGRLPVGLRSAARVGSVALVTSVVGATVLYALAFTSIYTRPVTRVAASDWIYENVPPGTPFAFEHWDDPIPLRLPGKDHEAYRGQQLTLYDDDNPEKLAKIEATLARSEYVFITSNRLYGSIPKLPMRYPLTTEYYRHLFSGELGFRLVAEFTSYPRLFGIVLNDDRAEEAFSVYDHPKVLIFNKTEAYSRERVHELLARVDLSSVVRLRPMQVPRNGLLMQDALSERQVAGGTWRATFDPDGLANRFPVVVWLVAAQALAWLCYPLVWRLLAGLADRGYVLAKTLGLVAVSYGAWLLASVQLLPYSRPSILLVAGVLALLSGLAVWPRRRAFADFLRAEWRVLALGEGVFLAAFGLFLGIRMLNPDLWHANFGGEKPMDYAYLNAVIKSTYFPPYDPWFAGGYINYYYFGFVLVATITKLTGVVPWVAYNLALSLFFALTVSGAFAVGFSALRGSARSGRSLGSALTGGALAAALVGLVGNLDGLAQTAEGLGKLGGANLQSRIPGLAGLVNAVVGIGAWAGGGALPPFDFWRSTRLIGPEDPGPISEFPFFTFLYGDLHAHLLALPITIAVVLLALNVVRLAEARSLVPTWPVDARGRARVMASLASRWFALVVLAGLLVGTLRATNTWDFPTYLALIIVAMGIGHCRQAGRLTVPAVLWTLAAGAGIATTATLLFLPYQRHYELFYAGVTRVKQSTSLIQFLTIFGLFFFVLGALLAIESALAWQRAGRAPGWVPASAGGAYRVVGLVPLPPNATGWLAAPSLVLAVVAVGLYLAGLQTAAFLVAMTALVVIHALRLRRSAESLLLLAMAGLATSIVLVPEVFALKGDVGRMNTVFKFYLQAWVLLSFVAAVSVVLVTRQLRRLVQHGQLSTAWTTGWGIGLTILLLGAAIYPLRATPVKLGHRFNSLEPTLDGMAYMTRAGYEDKDRDLRLPEDYAAIHWMLRNVEGSPVILEGNAGLYRWGSRFSIYTGLPTIIGWDWHQKQQRGDYAPWIDDRLKDVKTLYETRSATTASSLLRKYDVAYIVVGGLERAYYPAAGLEKFDGMVGKGLDVAYRAGSVTIYRVTSA